MHFCYFHCISPLILLRVHFQLAFFFKNHMKKIITEIGPVKFSVRRIFGDDKFRWEKFSVAPLHRNYFTPKLIVNNVPKIISLLWNRYHRSWNLSPRWRSTNLLVNLLSWRKHWTKNFERTWRKWMKFTLCWRKLSLQKVSELKLSWNNSNLKLDK